MNQNKIHVEGFHHVAIKVRDFDATIKFYCEVLGFQVSYAGGEGDGRAALIDTGKGNYVEVFAGAPEGERPQGLWFHIALECSDTNAAMERIRAAGVKVTMETKDTIFPSNPPLPIRIAFFEGPNGESIELFQVL